MASWGDPVLEYEKLFDQFGKFIEKECKGAKYVHLTSVGTVTADNLMDWNKIMSIFGRKIIDYAIGLARMQGRSEADWSDFTRAGYILESGRFSDILFGKITINDYIQKDEKKDTEDTTESD